MPRIEVIPTDWHTSPEKAAGDGTPTVDLCTNCATGIDEGDPTPLNIKMVGVVASVDVDHPPYEGGGYVCAMCGEHLDETNS